MEKAKIEYPNVSIDVDEELVPMTREELENMKIQHEINNNIKAKSDVKNMSKAVMKNNQLLVLKKIRDAKLSGENGITLEKEIYKGTGRDFRYKLKTTYGDVQKDKKSKCFGTTKKILYYIDFGIEQVGAVIESVHDSMV